jgi:ABC-type uncharacterized transport system permease subunit
MLLATIFTRQLKSRKHVSFEADSKILTLQTLSDIVYVLMLLKLFINKTEQRLTLRNCAFCLFTGRTVQLCFSSQFVVLPLVGQVVSGQFGAGCVADTTCPLLTQPAP